MLFQKLSIPNPLALHHLLSASASCLPALRRVHALVITASHAGNPFFAAKLVSLYAALGLPHLSSRAFHAVPPGSRDAFLHNSIIQAYFSNADFPLALRFFLAMLASGARPDHFTVPIAASACAELGRLALGASVHASCLKSCPFTADSVASGSALVYMYSKCGGIGDAFKVFDEMRVRDVVSWTALIVGCVRNGECELGLDCLMKMHRDEKNELVRPNSWTVEAGLQACLGLEALWEGRCLHGFSLKTSVGHCSSIKSLILSLYCKCERLDEALVAFHELADKDIISCTAIVGIYARKGLVLECLELYKEMTDSGVETDEIFLCCLLTGFVNSGCVLGGRAFHGIILRRNFIYGTLVVNSLLSMYWKFDMAGVAKKIFDVMSERDSESWNLMVSGYGKMGVDAECLDMFREFRHRSSDLCTDLNSLVSVISSCSRLGALCLGKSIHCHIVKEKTYDHTSVLNALVGMYGRCGRLDVARKIFDLTDRDIVSWNTLIAAYNYVGHSNEALLLFDRMLLEGEEPNATTLVSILSSCSNMAALQKGKWVHNYIKEMGLDCDVSLCTALIDMYAKCGQLETSRAIFDSMSERDEVSWNVMILGYGIHGYAKEALEISREMKTMGVKPNELTFLAALSACSHAGLVEEGRALFSSMANYSISPTLKHYACMVDLFARSGNLYEAEAMILSMPMKPDGGIWGALLGACRIHSNMEMGKRVAELAIQSDPEHDGYYILMSNLYSCFDRWEEVENLRGMMKNRGVKKTAGWSAVELDKRIDVFTVEDKSHPQCDEIYSLLEALCNQMEDWLMTVKEGYIYCQ